MANSVFVDIPPDAWKKVATNVVSGTVHKVTEKPQEYLQAYKQTGEAAPTLITEGVMVFENSRNEPIGSTTPIDVYLFALGTNGRVRVDL